MPRRIAGGRCGPEGRETVSKILRKALVDDDFIAETLGPDNTTTRQAIYEDPDLGFVS